MDTILGFDKNTVYAVIIILILITLGVITFHYYAFVSAGNKSAFSAGFGTGFTLLPYKEGFDGEHKGKKCDCTRCRNRCTPGCDCYNKPI